MFNLAFKQCLGQSILIIAPFQVVSIISIVWAPWQVVEDLSPASENLPAGGEVMEDLLHLQ